MIRFIFFFFLFLNSLTSFSQGVIPTAILPNSMFVASASLQRMDIFSGFTYQKNFNRIDVGASFNLGLRSTFGAHQVYTQLGSYLTYPLIQQGAKKRDFSFGPMLGVHASFLNIGNKLRQYDILLGYSMYCGKTKGNLKFFHQAGLGPFAEYFRTSTNTLVQSYAWNYHLTLGLAYAIY